MKEELWAVWCRQVVESSCSGVIGVPTLSGHSCVSVDEEPLDSARQFPSLWIKELRLAQEVSSLAGQQNYLGSFIKTLMPGPHAHPVHSESMEGGCRCQCFKLFPGDTEVDWEALELDAGQGPFKLEEF